MSDNASPYIPPNAVIAWCDDRYVYVATPLGDGQYIQKYPVTEAGFHKALSVLRQRWKEVTPHMVMVPTVPITRTRTKNFGSIAQQNAALAVLKRRGIV